MFLHISVILFTGEGGVGLPVCITGHMTTGICIQGVCIQRVCLQGAVCIQKGESGALVPPSDTTGYGQQTGGTRPTGRHSCC